MPANRFLRFLPLFPALALFGGICWYLNFTQDDAYISFRYVQNYLNGDGLVWNIGERVEGFTNFGWVVYLILWGSLGINYIVIAKFTGVLCGFAAIVVAWLTGEKVLEGKSSWLVYFPPYLLAASFAFAYWSPAGLETAPFVFLTLLSVYFFLQRSPALIASLALAVWVRPEGAVVAGLLVVIDWLIYRQWFGYALRSSLMALVLSLPYLIFKIGYYGSMLPNPFYAKTGGGLEQLTNGLDYTGRYLLQYGFLGLSVLVPLLFYRRVSSEGRAVLLFYAGWVVYLTLIGGDVLPIHRFYLPVLGLNAVLMAISIEQLTLPMAHRLRNAAAALVAVLCLAATVWVPLDAVKQFRTNEVQLTEKMELLAGKMKEWDSRNFSAATTTIGIFGYTLIGHTVIDMLGLTDSTIARHPEPPIAGMHSTWRERNYNTPYLLSRKPDYIAFSTSMKPSAPAERALMLYPQFLSAYRQYMWAEDYVDTSATGSTSRSYSIFSAAKRQRDYGPPYEARYPISWVEKYKKLLEEYNANRNTEAARLAGELRGDPTTPVYPELLYAHALLLSRVGEEQWAISLLDTAVAVDSLAEGPHEVLYTYHTMVGDPEVAKIHRSYLARLVPWQLHRLDSILALKMQSRGGRGD